MRMMPPLPPYPQREKYYAHKLTRLLFKSCAAQSIGQDAVLLIVHIAHTEDAARYSGPVRFWNSQLNETLGFRSPKKLNNARRKAMEAGWLAYDRKNDRADGKYFTLIPPSVLGFDDCVIEPVPSTESIPSTEQKQDRTEPIPRTESVPYSEQKAEQEGYALRNGKVTESGMPPIPVPNPIPHQSINQRDDDGCDDEDEISFDLKSNQIAGVIDFAKQAASLIVKKRGSKLTDSEWGVLVQAFWVGVCVHANVGHWIASVARKRKLQPEYFVKCSINAAWEPHRYRFDLEKKRVPFIPMPAEIEAEGSRRIGKAS